MQIKRIALGGIIMTVIMFSGCSTTVQNLAIGEEKTLETGKTEQESVTEKDINMNEKESFNAESNINDVIHDSAFDDYGRLIFPVDMEIEDNLKLKQFRRDNFNEQKNGTAPFDHPKRVYDEFIKEDYVVPSSDE